MSGVEMYTVAPYNIFIQAYNPLHKADAVKIEKFRPVGSSGSL
jgi:hypothetical protein